MMDLEQRLRDDLRERAGMVPVSAHPRADLERRLARRRAARWRVPVLATAAAAVVAAAVVLPVALNSNNGEGKNDQAATVPPTTEPSNTYEQPPSLGSYDDNGVRRQALFTLNGNNWCVSPTYQPDEPPIEATCQPIPVFPGTYPEAHELKNWVTTSRVLGEGMVSRGPMPDVLVFIAAPHVVRLEVRDGPGDPVPVRLVESLPGARFYVADFPESTDGFGYTAFDAQGNVVESAIT